MRAFIPALLVLSMLFLDLSRAEAACTRPDYGAQHMKTIPTRGIDQTLFSEAMAMEASYARCTRGKKGLVLAAPLTGIARAHSKWMAGAHKLSHVSTVAGQQKMKSRIRSTGLKYKTAAENIAAYSRFQFGNSEFITQSAGACRFEFRKGGKVPAHSYASLAEWVVAGWMGSSGHRRNLLNGRMKLVGAGIAFDAKAPNCGRFYITQEYLG